MANIGVLIDDMFEDGRQYLDVYFYSIFGRTISLNIITTFIPNYNNYNRLLKRNVLFIPHFCRIN